MTISRLLVLLCSYFFLSTGFAQSAEELLSKINEANRQHQFNGMLTYEYSGYLQAAKVEHRVVGNVVQQKITVIDGAAPSTVHRQALQECSSGQTRWGLWSSEVDMDALALGYHMSIQGRERLAGRDTSIVVLKPVDRFRYGYRLNIDEVTGLVIMRMRLLGEQIVDRTRYIDFSLVEDAELGEKSSIAPEASPCMAEPFKSMWALSWVPPGFQAVGNRITAQGEEVLMYSDGLAFVSVFITNPKPKNARLSSGATSVAMASFEAGKVAHSVIVMGEVPIEAADKMANSVAVKAGE